MLKRNTWNIFNVSKQMIARLAGAVQYTDCGKTHPNECPRYDSKQSDD